MDALTLRDILEIDAYARVRDQYRPRVMAHKKQRRVSVGPRVSLVFEDRETLRYQIQEMTRVERTTDPEKIQIELDVYNELVPGPGELSATLFIEIPELDAIQPELDRLVGIDEHVALVLDGLEDEPVVARFDDRQMEEDRISAVHYLRFTFSDAQLAAWRTGAGARLRIDHANYQHESPIEGVTRESLSRDLENETPSLLDPEEMQRAREATDEILLETLRVRARRLSPPGKAERVVVESVGHDGRFLDADAELITELVTTAQQVARQVQDGAGAARVRVDWLAGERGPLRIEIQAIR